MVPSCSAMGETAWSCPCLAPQTCSVPDSVRTELRTLRLAIACRDRTDRPCTHRKSQEGHHASSYAREENKRAWREHWKGVLAIATLGKGRVRAIDCKAIGGSGGWRTITQGWAGELWAKDASRRAQGWAGENGDRSDRGHTTSQVATGAIRTLAVEQVSSKVGGSIRVTDWNETCTRLAL